MLKRIFLYISILIITAPYAASAASTDWIKREEVAVRLVAGDKLQLGLQFKLTGHWHTYWKHPGDGGMSMKIDWSKSKNIKKAQLNWPAPQRFLTIFEGFAPIETFGYEKDVTFPIRIIPEDITKPVIADISVKYAVCDETCIFFEDKFKLDIPVGYIADKELNSIIDKGFASIPQKNENGGMAIDSAKVKDGVLEIRASASAKKPFNKPDIFVTGSMDFRFPQPKVTIANHGKLAIIAIPYEKLLKKDLYGEKLELTLTDDKGTRAVVREIVIPAEAATAPNAESTVKKKL